MFHIVVLSTYAMHFATFAAHSPPPIAIKPKPIVEPMSDRISFASSASNKTLTGYVGYVAPTLSSCCTIVCCDEDDMHCFRYTSSNILKRCTWGVPSSVWQKAIGYMRYWYIGCANADLTLDVDDETDELSWLMSTELLRSLE